MHAAGCLVVQGSQSCWECRCAHELWAGRALLGRIGDKSGCCGMSGCASDAANMGTWVEAPWAARSKDLGIIASRPHTILPQTCRCHDMLLNLCSCCGQTTLLDPDIMAHRTSSYIWASGMYKQGHYKVQLRGERVPGASSATLAHVVEQCHVCILHCLHTSIMAKGEQSMPAMGW